MKMIAFKSLNIVIGNALSRLICFKVHMYVTQVLSLRKVVYNVHTVE